MLSFKAKRDKTTRLSSFISKLVLIFDVDFELSDSTTTLVSFFEISHCLISEEFFGCKNEV